MMDLIRISTTDPVWVTWGLVLMRFVGVLVIAWWVTSMVRTNQGTPIWHNRSVLWPWSLTGWMVAVAILLISGIIRSLVVGHIRDLTAIGMGYRVFEIAVAINFATWSVITYWRWRHPEPTIVQEGVFGTLAQALPIIVSNHEGTIQHTTDEFNTLIGALPGELIGKPLETIMPERYVAGHHHGMQRYIETREPHIMGTVVVIDMLRRDGVEIPVYLALNTTDVDGKPWFVASLWVRPRVEPEVLTPAFGSSVVDTIDQTATNVEEMKVDVKTLRKHADAADVRADASDVRADVAEARADAAETERTNG